MWYAAVDIWLILGESNVYTIGYIGQHKVVSTKLPAVGRQMAAQISSGNTTTRLLGMFCIHIKTIHWPTPFKQLDV